MSLYIVLDVHYSVCALIAFVVFVKSLVSHILSVNSTGISIGQGSSDQSGQENKMRRWAVTCDEPLTDPRSKEQIVPGH